MIHVDKHAMSRESSSEKFPFPEKFQEPDNMISVELNTFADNVADSKPQKFDVRKIRSKVVKLCVLIGLLSLIVIFLMVVIRKNDKVSKHFNVATEHAIEISPKTDSVKRMNLEKCLQSKQFEDCCMYENDNGKYLTHVDCTVNKILKLFAEFEEYYDEMNEEIKNMQSEIIIEQDLEYLEKRRKRRGINYSKENNQYYDGKDYIHSEPIHESNHMYYNERNYGKLDGENAQTIMYDNNLQPTNHEAINYMPDEAHSAGISIQQTGNYEDYYNSNHATLESFDTNIGHGGYELETQHDTRKETTNYAQINPMVHDENIYQYPPNLNIMEYSNLDPLHEEYEENPEHSYNPGLDSYPENLNPINIFDLEGEEAADIQNISPIVGSNMFEQQLINNDMHNENYNPEDLQTVDLDLRESAYYSRYGKDFHQSSIKPNQNGENYRQSPDMNDLTHSDSPQQVTTSTTDLSTSSHVLLNKFDINSMEDNIHHPKIEKSSTETLEQTTENMQDLSTQTQNPDHILLLNRLPEKADTFRSNDEENKLNLNIINAREFQGSKSKINPYQTANIDLHTSQHSTANTNFIGAGTQCQLVGSSFPVMMPPQPFNYDSSQGTQFAQLLPLNFPKSNPYIVPPAPYVQPNYNMYQTVGYPYQTGYNSYYTPTQNMATSFQAATPSGQYYICNPIPQPTNNVIHMPGVEIRSNSNNNLQDLLEDSIQFEEVNNKTRESDKCPFDEHMCADNLKCIKRLQICDGHVNCNDASDEAYCSCKYRVGNVRLCDGYFDCPNGEDELGCFGCGKKMFSCDDWSEDDRIASCVTLEERCDGEKQCPTGKDEEDCTILTDRIAEHQRNKISNSVGFLHRNYKGKWYPACSNPESWAADACNAESGPSRLNPLTHMIPVQFTYQGPYINSLADGKAQLASSCVPGRAVYVECPEPSCGIRKLFENSYRGEEVDTSAENLLMNLIRSTRDSNMSDPILSVVGGRPSQPAAWPWVVSIYRNGIFHCGGTILNPNWIITAAHCVDKYWQYYYEVEAGILRRFSYSPMEQNRFVSHVIPHKDYDRANLKNDLALMRLSAPLRYNRYVRPICLPNEFTAGPNFFRGPSPGTICTAVGWGATVEHGADPDHLREVNVPILSHCKHIEDEIGDEICAGFSEGGRDACQGDSGGPFLCKNPIVPNQWYLAGIVSHGEGCARPNEPGVYTRVSKYIEWIYHHATELILPKLVPLYRCPGYTCRLTNKCLPKRRRCDKIVDCLVGDDEMGCDSSAITSLFKNAIKEMYLGNVRNVSYDNANKYGDNIDNNTLKEENKTSSLTVNKPEHDLNTTKEDPASFATLPYASDKNHNITNIKDTTLVYTDITTENYKIDESEEELILTTAATKTQTTRTGTAAEFAYAAVSNDIVPALNNDTDKIDATFLCTRMLQVIPLRKRCNKIADCQDATDEENCKCLDYLKTKTPDAICNGITDCYDLSDEDTCGTCKENEFRCRLSNKCIPLEKKCDRVPDCFMDEDELDCVALMNSTTIKFDQDMRPVLNVKGIVSINNNGSWKTLCANPSGIESSTAADVCLSLGFTDYKEFQKLSIDSRLLDRRVAGSNSVLDDAKKTVPNQDKCDALYVKCSNTTNVDLTHQIGTESKSTTRNLHNLPWNAAVYVDGKYECIGIILNFNWILTSAACFDKDSLNNHYVAVLLGTMRPHLNVGGPHDQVIRVVDVVPVPKADMFMLRLEEEIKITRYASLALFHWRKYVARTKETCVAVDGYLKLLRLKSLSDCDAGRRCFKRISEVRSNCSKEDASSGYIMCNDGNGWYPASFYSNRSTKCDFRYKDSYLSISFSKKSIFWAMDQNAFKTHLPTCNGFRCKLGQCLRKERICDDIPDCNYGEDEEQSFCKKWKQECHLTQSCHCLPSELRCRNGNCVEKSKFCDSVNDCGDLSDEPDVCDCYSYLRLTDANKICDGDINCFDKSDENPKICPCNEERYSCQNSSICVPEAALCDGAIDCPYADDEEFCISLISVNTGNSSVGEVYIRTAGLWHPECFPKNTSTEDLNAVCIKLGFTKIFASHMYLSDMEVNLNTTKPVTDDFDMVMINDNVKLLIRTGNEPYVSLQEDEDCMKLFVQCI